MNPNVRIARWCRNYGRGSFDHCDAGAFDELLSILYPGLTKVVRCQCLKMSGPLIRWPLGLLLGKLTVFR